MPSVRSLIQNIGASKKLSKHKTWGRFPGNPADTSLWCGSALSNLQVLVKAMLVKVPKAVLKSKYFKGSAYPLSVRSVTPSQAEMRFPCLGLFLISTYFIVIFWELTHWLFSSVFILREKNASITFALFPGISLHPSWTLSDNCLLFWGCPGSCLFHMRVKIIRPN